VEAWLLSLQEQKNMATYFTTCLLKLDKVRANAAKFGMHVGNMQHNTQKGECLVILKIINFIILTMYFSIQYVQ
jgi:hypothetical protein